MVHSDRCEGPCRMFDGVHFNSEMPTSLSYWIRLAFRFQAVASCRYIYYNTKRVVDWTHLVLSPPHFCQRSRDRSSVSWNVSLVLTPAWTVKHLSIYHVCITSFLCFCESNSKRKIRRIDFRRRRSVPPSDETVDCESSTCDSVSISRHFWADSKSPSWNQAHQSLNRKIELYMEIIVSWNRGAAQLILFQLHRQKRQRENHERWETAVVMKASVGTRGAYEIQKKENSKQANLP